LEVVLSYINPSELRPATRVCDAGKSDPKGNCINREDLLESLKAVLFPAEGTKIIDYGGDQNAEGEGKDEL
jgi:hypothetical protein